MSLNDFDLHLVVKYNFKGSFSAVKMWFVIVKRMMDFVFVPFFILPLAIKQLFSRLASSVVLNYLAIGMYRLVIFYPVYVSAVVGSVIFVLLLAGIWLCFNVKPGASFSAQRRVPYQQGFSEDDNLSHATQDYVASSLSDSRSGSSWLWKPFSLFRANRPSERTIAPSFTVIQKDSEGETKLDGYFGGNSTNNKMPSRRSGKPSSHNQLEAVPENPSEEDTETPNSKKIHSIKLDGRVQKNYSPKRRKSAQRFSGGKINKASYSPIRKLSRDAVWKLNHDADNDSQGPGSSINQEMDFGKADPNNAAKSVNATVLSDMTPPPENGPSKGPGSTIYSLGEEPPVSHPMWR